MLFIDTEEFICESKTLREYYHIKPVLLIEFSLDVFTTAPGYQTSGCYGVNIWDMSTKVYVWTKWFTKFICMKLYGPISFLKKVMEMLRELFERPSYVVLHVRKCPLEVRTYILYGRTISEHSLVLGDLLPKWTKTGISLLHWGLKP